MGNYESSRPMLAAGLATRDCCAGRRSRLPGWRARSTTRCAGWRMAASAWSRTRTAGASLSDHGVCNRERQADRYRLHRTCRCRSLLSYPISSAVEAAQIRQSAAWSLRVPGLPLPFHRSAHQQMRNPPLRGVARTGVCLAIEAVMDAIARETRLEPSEVRLRNMVQRSRCRSITSSATFLTAGIIPNACGAPSRRSAWRASGNARGKSEPDGRLIGVGLSFFVEQGAHGTPCSPRGPSHRPRLRTGQREAHP